MAATEMSSQKGDVMKKNMSLSLMLLKKSSVSLSKNGAKPQSLGKGSETWKNRSSLHDVHDDSQTPVNSRSVEFAGIRDHFWGQVKRFDTKLLKLPTLDYPSVLLDLESFHVKQKELDAFGM